MTDSRDSESRRPRGDDPDSGDVALADPVDSRTRDAGVADETCPSCDAPGSWRLSKRHRFNPFGGVTLLVLAFWATLAGALLDVGYWPAGVLGVLGVVTMLARRTALVCQVCGFVKPQ